MLNLVNAILTETSLSDAEGLAVLKVVRSCAAWAFLHNSAATEDLPLHIAVQNLVSLDMLKIIVEANPAATGIQVDNGDTLVHVLIETILEKDNDNWKKDASDFQKLENDFEKYLERLYYLISVTPRETFLLRDQRGRTPLCKLMSYNSEHGDTYSLDFGMRRALFDACPEAAQICDRKHMLPFEYYVYDCICDKFGRHGELLEVEGNYPEEVKLLKDMLVATGEAFFVQDPSGLYCINRMFRSEGWAMPCPWVIQMVCEAFPNVNALRVNLPRGGTPLHISLARGYWSLALLMLDQYPEAALLKDPLLGRTVLHAAATRIYRVKDLEVVYTSNPSAIKETTTGGDLPLHYFVRSSLCPELERKLREASEDLRWFLRLFPGSAAVQNKKGETPYSIYCSLHRHDPNDDLIRLFLMACPHLDPSRLREINYQKRRVVLLVLHHLRRAALPDSSSSGCRESDAVVSESLASAAGTSFAAEGGSVSGAVGAVADAKCGLADDDIYAVWWMVANRADTSITKEVASYL
jgi:hypothetical protein